MNLDADIAARMAVHATERRHTERFFHKDSRHEHMTQLNLRVPVALTEACVVAAHLRSVGVDVTALHAAIDAVRVELYRAAIPVLSALKPDTEARAEGQKR